MSNTTVCEENKIFERIQRKETKQGPFLVVQKQRKKTYLLQSKGKVWKERENARFLAFAKINLDKLDSISFRQRWKCLSMMAKFVRTRNVNQCRSHLSKIVKQFNDINQFYKHLIAVFPKIEELVKSYLEDLQNPQTFPNILCQKNKQIKEENPQIVPQCFIHQPLKTHDSHQFPSLLHRSDKWLRSLSYKSSLSENLFRYFYPDLQYPTQPFDDYMVQYGGEDKEFNISDLFRHGNSKIAKNV